MEPSGRRTKGKPSPPAADALTSLPAHLLDDILTRLDICDIIRTSALSRAWRFRWESLPTLSLSLDRPDTPPEAVDGVLLRYAGCISHFSFRLNPESASRNYRWLIALSRRRVESMNLRNSIIGDVLFKLHSSIFSCVNLVTLKLHQCYFPHLPPGFSGFPSLEELILCGIEFVDDKTDKLEAIFRRSPLLQVLNLTYVYVGSGDPKREVGDSGAQST